MHACIRRESEIDRSLSRDVGLFNEVNRLTKFSRAPRDFERRVNDLQSHLTTLFRHAPAARQAHGPTKQASTTLWRYRQPNQDVDPQPQARSSYLLLINTVPCILPSDLIYLLAPTAVQWLSFQYQAKRYRIEGLAPVNIEVHMRIRKKKCFGLIFVV